MIYHNNAYYESEIVILQIVKTSKMMTKVIVNTVANSKRITLVILKYNL